MDLIHITAHYHGDRPNGLNLCIRNTDLADLGVMLNELRQGWDRMWRDAVNKASTYGLVLALEHQLEEIQARRQGERYSTEDALLAIANIDLLERVGHLKSDDYNGVMLVYGSKAARKTEPSG